MRLGGTNVTIPNNKRLQEHCICKFIFVITAHKKKNIKIINSSTESDFRSWPHQKCHMSSWLLFFIAFVRKRKLNKKRATTTCFVVAYTPAGISIKFDIFLLFALSVFAIPFEPCFSLLPKKLHMDNHFAKFRNNCRINENDDTLFLFMFGPIRLFRTKLNNSFHSYN